MKRLILILFVLVMLVPAHAQDTQAITDAWWHDRVWYSLFVRSFYDSDGDGVGDLQGIIEQLDYLEDLGIGGLWLLPVFESTSYHGYDVEDYRAIDPDYGTMDDMLALVQAAHERDIAIILDFPVNHTSSNHPWFVSSVLGEEPYDDWYIWEDEDPGYAGPWGAQAWHPRGGRYFYGVFWGGMPDLNLENPEVNDELYDITRFWLEEVGVDGFRMDAIKHLIEDGQIQENTPATRQWLADFRAFAQSVDPDAFIIGEVFNTPAFRVAAYLNDGSVDAAFDFDFAVDLIRTVQRGNTRDLVRGQEDMLENYEGARYAAFLSNHDQDRAMTQMLEDFDRAKMAATLLMTNPGTPFLYYGEEIGMIGAKPDERLRTPMHWTDDPETVGFTAADEPWQEPQALENIEVANVALQDDDPDSLLNHYRRMIALRNEHAPLTDGHYLLLESASNRVYSFLRYTEDEAVLVFLNVDDRPAEDFLLRVEEGEGDASVFERFSEVEWLVGEGEFVLPELNADGTLEGYNPLPELDELPPYATYIVKLS